jgi:hypothetical protein
MCVPGFPSEPFTKPGAFRPGVVHVILLQQRFEERLRQVPGFVDVADATAGICMQRRPARLAELLERPVRFAAAPVSHREKQAPMSRCEPAGRRPNSRDSSANSMSAIVTQFGRSIGDFRLKKRPRSAGRPSEAREHAIRSGFSRSYRLFRSAPSVVAVVPQLPRPLQSTVAAADTTGMEPLHVTELRAHESWRQVLAAYEIEQVILKKIDPNHAGWVPRLREIDGVPDEDLPVIHGRLIAFGLLKFQLAGRNDGVQYQISTAGREALSPGNAADADSDEAATDAA